MGLPAHYKTLPKLGKKPNKKSKNATLTKKISKDK
jgi:hypothetical protein